MELRTQRQSLHILLVSLVQYLLKLNEELNLVLKISYRKKDFPQVRSFKQEQMKKASMVPMGFNNFPLSPLNNTNINPHYLSLLSP